MVKKTKLRKMDLKFRFTITFISLEIWQYKLHHHVALFFSIKFMVNMWSLCRNNTEIFYVTSGTVIESDARKPAPPTSLVVPS